MPSQNYQDRGPNSRTALITIRVFADDRELLHEFAEERGQTLSRVMLSAVLPAARRARAKRLKANRAVAVSASVCVPEPASPARPDAKRLREVGVIAGQESLFGDLGGGR